MKKKFSIFSAGVIMTQNIQILYHFVILGDFSAHKRLKSVKNGFYGLLRVDLCRFSRGFKRNYARLGSKMVKFLRNYIYQNTQNLSRFVIFGDFWARKRAKTARNTIYVLFHVDLCPVVRDFKSNYVRFGSKTVEFLHDSKLSNSISFCDFVRFFGSQTS